MNRPLLALLSFAVLACGDDTSFVNFDAGPRPDVSTPDAGTDTGTPDAGDDTGTTCESGQVPLGRGEHTSVVDPARNRIIAHGGNIRFPEMCMTRSEYSNELWVFDLTCGTWQNMTPLAGGPGRRARQAAVYDEANDRILYFGGRTAQGNESFTNKDDLHALDLETMLWTELPATGPLPRPRSHAALALDTANNRLIMFGGNEGSNVIFPETLNDTWAYDLGTNQWSELSPTSAPSARYGHAFAQNEETLYVFGGTSGGFLNDTWAFSFADDEWTQIAGGGASAPRTRFGAGLFVDGSGALLMAAGHDSSDLGNTNEIWRVDIATGAWTEITPGDTLNGTPIGRCDFPPDFTIPDLDAPERRNFQGYAQGPSAGYMVFGKTDCGNANDVWAIDFSTPAWELLGSATTSGEACNRSGRDDCTTLCF